MKKIISILLALIIVLTMAITAFAATPTLKVPELPEIPDISDNVKVDVTPSVNKWLDEHPFQIDLSKFDWSKWFR